MGEGYLGRLGAFVNLSRCDTNYAWRDEEIPNTGNAGARDKFKILR
jgi:hypothetical protein